jgi:pimeloyl-ACP methyl ester carboxylesterase
LSRAQRLVPGDSGDWHKRQVAPLCRHSKLSETSDTKESLDVPRTTTGDCDRHSAGALHKSEPFQTYFDVPVAGGALTVARAGPPPEAGQTVVLVLHGMTSCHMAYRAVARELCSNTPSMCLLAPDLRGRGRNAQLPEPYGIAVHVADLVAVLDHAGADRALVVGHSMGSNIAARFAEEHPERVAAVVLLDSGLPIVSEHAASDGEEEDEDEPHGLLYRVETTFATVEEYVAYWRSHPALEGAWDEDVDAYVRCDYVVDEDGVRCVVNETAVLTDLANLTFDGVTQTSVTRVRVPVRLMRAERGLFDDNPLIPLPELQEFLRHNPHVSVEMVPDVNHYTILMGRGNGPRRVAATLAELARVLSKV